MVTLATVPDERGVKDWSGQDLEAWSEGGGSGGDPKGREERMELRDESEVSQKESLATLRAWESIYFNTKK